MSIHSDYETKYGLTAKMVLRDLGGDPDAIINDYIHTANDCPSFLLDGMSGLFQGQAPEDDVHNLIQREIETLYFKSISRDAAVAICNALGAYGTISIHNSLPDLSYNSYAFMSAWTAANPDQKEIIPPAAMDI